MLEDQLERCHCGHWLTEHSFTVFAIGSVEANTSLPKYHCKGKFNHRNSDGIDEEIGCSCDGFEP
jgi:hypothetical protein